MTLIYIILFFNLIHTKHDVVMKEIKMLRKYFQEKRDNLHKISMILSDFKLYITNIKCSLFGLTKLYYLLDLIKNILNNEELNKDLIIKYFYDLHKECIKLIDEYLSLISEYQRTLIEKCIKENDFILEKYLNKLLKIYLFIKNI
ncbi:hypothetical protein H312_02052 [Anncaliia algerae PRA339]|uniref:Uncharacterized protein n=1 Tax=Anncaliia algerae PRA339 TaxID=1288291 RepID=A0A059F078_9MICR|nr:hypothetical protein H312_02052 [Anncaliia algerae PRA339]